VRVCVHDSPVKQSVSEERGPGSPLRDACRECSAGGNAVHVGAGALLGDSCAWVAGGSALRRGSQCAWGVVSVRAKTA